MGGVLIYQQSRTFPNRKILSDFCAVQEDATSLIIVPLLYGSLISVDPRINPHRSGFQVEFRRPRCSSKSLGSLKGKKKAKDGSNAGFFLVAMFPSKCTWPVTAGAKGNATRTLQLCWKKGSSRPSFHFTIKKYQGFGWKSTCTSVWFSLNTELCEWVGDISFFFFLGGGSNRLRCFVSDCHQTYMMTRSRGSRLWWLVQLFFMYEMTYFLH